MPVVTEVSFGERDIRRLAPHVGEERVQQLLRVAEQFQQWLGDRTIWNLNSTAVGGGVAEMLLPLLSYSHSLGIRVRWLVMGGTPEFFRITKRLHHALHGSPGDGTLLDPEAHRIYRSVTRENADALRAYVQPGDLVLLHDPQTAGMAEPLLARDAGVLWRCHIGHDEPDEEVERGWRFLAPYLDGVPAYVFSRRAYVPTFVHPERAHVIQPSIDALAPKNEVLDPDTVRAILVHVGLLRGNRDGRPRFVCTDGTERTVRHRADVLTERLPDPETPLIVQVSRWDPLKDMSGVLRGFEAIAGAPEVRPAHLLLAGPDVRGVADDPEGPAAYEKVRTAWHRLPPTLRQRVTLAMLPTVDIEENAAIVNAIQRHATIVTQKSLREGFGLTVTEAMWKKRPVVASAVGGIQDQIDHGVDGLLLDDPEDLHGFGEHVRSLLADPERARRIGVAAQERVRQHFLGVRHLLQYAELLPRVAPSSP